VGLHKLMEEDAMLRFFSGSADEEFLIAGRGSSTLKWWCRRCGSGITRSGAEGAEGSVSGDDTRKAMCRGGIKSRRAGTGSMGLQDQDGAVAA